MSRYFCDLHIHSCLSPCADDDMTPGNIAGMAMLNGLQIAALTDHNTCRNCPAFFAAAKKVGIIPIPGMELTTAEDIHVVCLFPTLEAAMDFDRFVDGHRPFVKNKPELFGRQILVGEDDEPTGEVEKLLWNAADLTLEDAYREVTERGGVCFPAHIDRPGNGILETLGCFPCDPPYTAFETKDGKTDGLTEKYPVLSELLPIRSSDAHRLHEIQEAVFSLEIADEPYSRDLVRRRLISLLGGE